MNLRVKFVFSIGLLSLLCLMLPGVSRADDFTFSFTNTDGNVSGVVTGEILGLTDNTTGPAAQVLIESYPAAIASIIGPGPINAMQLADQLVNSFTEAGGVVTAASFAAYNPQPGIFDEFVINYGARQRCKLAATHVTSLGMNMCPLKAASPQPTFNRSVRQFRSLRPLASR
jgi:hypothetical protein